MIDWLKRLAGSEEDEQTSSVPKNARPIEEAERMVQQDPSLAPMFEQTYGRKPAVQQKPYQPPANAMPIDKAEQLVRDDPSLADTFRKTYGRDPAPITPVPSEDPSMLDTALEAASVVSPVARTAKAVKDVVDLPEDESEPSAVEKFKVLGETIPASFKASIAGMGEATVDMPVEKFLPPQLQLFQRSYRAAKSAVTGKPLDEPIRYGEIIDMLAPGTSLTLRDKAHEAAQEAEETIRRANQDASIDPGETMYYVNGILQATAEMAPMVTATLLTRNPGIGMGVMGSQVFGREYSSAIESGRSQDEAFQDATFYALVESVTEKLPLDFITRYGKKGLKGILTAGVAEGLQESLTEALGMGYETGVLGENAFVDPETGDFSLIPAMKRLRDAGIIGFGAGGLMRTGVETGRSLAERAEDRQYRQNIDRTEQVLRGFDESDLRTIPEYQHALQNGMEPPEALRYLAKLPLVQEAALKGAETFLAETVETEQPVDMDSVIDRISRQEAVQPSEASTAVKQGYAKWYGDTLTLLPAGRRLRAQREEERAKQQHLMPDGTVMAGVEHPGAVPGSTVVASEAAGAALPEAGQQDVQAQIAEMGAQEIEQAAAEAATSDQNALPEPTDAQKEAGNYKKGKIRLHGMDVSIENPAGSKRRPEWPPLQNHYGYIRRTEAADGDQLDAFLGPQAADASKPVFVVDQTKPDGSFDEQKALLGWDTPEAAAQGYLSNYSPDFKGLGRMVQFDSVEQFREWAEKADGKRPAYETAGRYGGQLIETPVVDRAAIDTEVSKSINIPKTDTTEESEDRIEPGKEFTALPRGVGKLSFTAIENKGESPADGSYRITPARYARGKALIVTPGLDGYKTRAARLAEAVGGKYTGRENGYIVSPSAAERFQKLFSEGRDASVMTGKLEEPKQEPTVAPIKEERREDTATRERIEKLPPDERDAEIKRLRAYTAELEERLRINKLTGLPNLEAWQKDESGYSTVGAMDMDGLGWFNENWGHETTNEILRRVGEVMQTYVTDDVKLYHLHGDEFALGTNLPAREADAILTRLQEELDSLLVEVEGINADGESVVYQTEGVGLTFGISKTYKEADNEAIKAKQTRESAGLRAAKGQEPVGVGRVAARAEGRDAAAEEAEVSPPSEPRFARAPQTDTKAFRDWFGDSKVVDDDGSPLVVYHGTNRDFDRFDPTRAGESTGGVIRRNRALWFADKPDVATGFAYRAASGEASGMNVVPVYLSTQNPLVVDLAKEESPILDEYYQEAIDKGHDGLILKNAPDSVDTDIVFSLDGQSVDIDSRGGFADLFEMHRSGELSTKEYVAEIGNFASEARAEAEEDSDYQDEADMWQRIHDAIKDDPSRVTMELSGRTDVYAVFNPTQVKSAIGNRGTFDPGDPDIRFSKAAHSELDTELIEEAKKRFGTTFLPKEAGYVLPDGSMLDFTGRHYSQNHPSLRNQRSVDHRELAGEDMETGEEWDLVPDSESASDGMLKFMDRAHAIRVDFTANVVSAVHVPTSQQLDALDNAMRNRPSDISYVRPDNGEIADEVSLETTTRRQIEQFFEQAEGKKGSGVLFRRGERPVSQPRNTRIKRVITDMANEFAGRPIVQTFDTVADLLEQNPGLGRYISSPQDIRDTKGIYVPGSNPAVYIIAENSKNTDDAIETLMHEMIGHHGVHAILGDAEYAEIMDAIAAAMPGKIREAIKRNGLDKMNLSPEQMKRVAAEEIIAYTAQDIIAGRTTLKNLPDKLRFWFERVLAAVRRVLGLSDPKINANITDTDIIHMIARSYDYVRSGRAARTLRMGYALRSVEYPAFIAQLVKTVNDKLPERASPKEYLNAIKANLKKPGLTREEFASTGLEDKLNNLTLDDIRKINWPAADRDNPKAGQKPVKQLSKAQLVELIDESIETVNAKFAKARIPEFYSALSSAAESLKQQKGAAEQMLAAIRNQPGVKAEELEWTGLEEYLQLRGSESVTKAEIVEYLRNNGVQVETITKRGQSSTAEGVRQFGGGSTKFAQYTLPGGENYREVLLTLPPNSVVGGYIVAVDGLRPPDAAVFATEAEANAEARRMVKSNPRLARRWKVVPSDKGQKDINFRSSHFDEPNILAHVRLKDFTDANGDKVLLVEEMQSDWHKTARKQGYGNPEKLKAANKEFSEAEQAYDEWARSFSTKEFANKPLSEIQASPQARRVEEARKNLYAQMHATPDAPFKGNAWIELATKRVLQLAVEGGYARVAWTPGDIQADRYDLSKQIKQVIVEKWNDGEAAWERGKVHVKAYDFDDNTVITRTLNSVDELDDIIGKDAAKKAREQLEETKDQTIPKADLRGLDLKVGGEGMKGFYDRTLPNIVKGIARKLDKAAKVEPTTIQSEDAVEALSIPITDKMRAGIEAGLPLFAKERKEREVIEGFRAKRQGAVRKTLPELVKEWTHDWKARLNQAAFDEFYSIKRAEREVAQVPKERMGYISARLAKGADDVLRALLEFGAPEWDSKDWATRASTYSKTVKPFFEVLQPIRDAELLEQFKDYLVAYRAQRLKAEDRENLFTREEIETVLNLSKQHPILEEVRQEYAKLNKALLDFAQEAGVVNPDTRKLWENEDYVPFYRVVDDASKGELSGPFTGTGRLANLGKVIRRLRGGRNNMGDPIDNIIMNWSALIRASLNNHAAVLAIDNLDGTGLVTKARQVEFRKEMVPRDEVAKRLREEGAIVDDMSLDGFMELFAMKPPEGDNILNVFRNGKREYWEIHDPLVFRSMTAIGRAPFGAWMNIFRIPKRVMTAMITLAPDFSLRNWFRDAWSSFVLRRDSKAIPMVDGAKGFVKALRTSDEFKEMMAGGATFESGYVTAHDPGAVQMVIRARMRNAGFRKSIVDKPMKFLEMYRDITSAAENANRVPIYQDTLKGKDSRKLALYEAKDIMDFSMRGSSNVARFLAESVAFFNARLQGLYRIPRTWADAETKQERQRLLASVAVRGMMIMVPSLFLYLNNRRLKCFNKLPDYDKDTYYHIFVGDESQGCENMTHFRLPKPFEVGAVFATIPERMLEAALSKEPDRGEKLASRLAWIFGEMLNMNPVPTTMEGPIELMLNRDSFRDAPILNTYDEKLIPELQYDYRTPPTYRFISEHAANMPGAPDWLKSPKQLEHLVSSYAGTLFNDYAILATDAMVRAAQDYPPPPAKRLDEIPFVKSFVRDAPLKYTADMDAMYNIYRDVSKYALSMKEMEKRASLMGATGNKALTERLEAQLDWMEKTKEPELIAAEELGAAIKAIGGINEEIMMISLDADMTPEEKRKEIDELYKQRNDIAEDAIQFRPGGPENLREEDKEKAKEKPEEVFKKISGLTRKKQVDSLMDAGLPQTAMLVDAIPPRLPRQLQVEFRKALEESA